jgi:hypothetical protein
LRFFNLDEGTTEGDPVQILAAWHQQRRIEILDKARPYTTDMSRKMPEGASLLEHDYFGLSASNPDGDTRLRIPLLCPETPLRQSE